MREHHQLPDREREKYGRLFETTKRERIQDRRNSLEYAFQDDDALDREGGGPGIMTLERDTNNVMDG